MRKSDDNVNHVDNARPAEILELVHSIMHEYRSMQFRLLRDGPQAAAVTHMDAKVLGFFDRRPGATQSDLAEHSGRDKAQLARLIKGLREQGLLQAEADEADRRSVRLSLTPEGKAIQRGLRQQARRLSAKALAGLGEAEQTQLLALLQRLRENLGAG